MKRSLLCVAFAFMAMSLIAVPGQAGDCDFGPSAGRVPESAAGCQAAPSFGDRPSFDPTDMAVSPDGVLTSCATMTLNDPANVSTVGFVDFMPACDFAGNDFSTLYCYDFNVPATLFAVDVTSCSASAIGTANNGGAQSFSGMAWDPTTSTMYGSTTDIATSELVTVDLNTGASTSVGTMTDSPGNISIGIDNSGNMFGHDITTDSLHSIDKNTGASSLIGAVGFDANFAQGMDFDASDNTCYLFAFNNTSFQAELYTCDTGSGAASFVGVIGSSSPGGLQEWTGPGIMAEDDGGGCVMHMTAGATGLGNSRVLNIDLHLTHVRPRAVERSFKVTLVDARGRVVARMSTPSVRLRPNETVARSYGLDLPDGLAPGSYTVNVSINGMAQGKVKASAPITLR